MDPDMSYVEVPDHLVAPKGRTKREIMKRAAILKCGSTGYGCPVGFSGYVTYPVSEIEKQLYVCFLLSSQFSSIHLCIT